MRRLQFTWTQDRTERLALLWNEGRTAPEIAATLGTTEGTVLRKVRRSDLPKRFQRLQAPADRTWTDAEVAGLIGEGWSRPEVARLISERHTCEMTVALVTQAIRQHEKINGPIVRPGRTGRAIVTRLVETVEDEPVETIGKALIDLRPGDCHFAVTPHKAAKHFFCGEPAEPGKPYCSTHCAVAYAPPPVTRSKFVPMRKMAA